MPAVRVSLARRLVLHRAPHRRPGHKVAICEQVEDPPVAPRASCKREVVRVITPGLVVDPDNLEAKQNNFLAGIAVRGEGFGLAFLDISTGEFRVTEVVDRNFFIDEVIRHGFREIVLEENLKDAVLETVLARELADCVINRFPGTGSITQPHSASSANTSPPRRSRSSSPGATRP